MKQASSKTTNMLNPMTKLQKLRTSNPKKVSTGACHKSRNLLSDIPAPNLTQQVQSFNHFCTL